MVDNRFYAIPNFDALILGGTAYFGDWNAEVSEQASPLRFAATFHRGCLVPKAACPITIAAT